MFKLIAFGGKQGSGKSFLAKYCEKELGYEIVSLAKHLKIMIAESLNIPISDLNKYKNHKNDFTYKIDYNIIHKHTGISKDLLVELQYREFNTIREILQYVGTDIIRKYQSDWHINKTKEYILQRPNSKICIDDVRFINELDFIKELGGECFYIQPTVGSSFSFNSISVDHISENDISPDLFDDDHIILNDKTESFVLDFVKRSIFH